MKSMLLAWQFLTRLPLKIRGEVNADHLAGSLIFFPLVGALIGLLLQLGSLLFTHWLPPLTSGLLLVAMQVLITGGLHLDGIGDLGDAWYGSQDQEKRLDIMRDSRLGALGAISLLLVITIKASLLAKRQPYWQSLVLYEAGAKLIMVLAIVIFPYARSAGTGAMFKKAKTRHVAIAALLPLLILILAPWQISLAVALATLSSWLMAHRLRQALGGLTGDCYGALHEIWQIFFLIALEVIS